MLARLTRRWSHRGWACEAALRLTPVERALLTSSSGRLSISGALGVPLLLLHARGARTGRWRSVPVVFTRVGHGYLVAGSNGGRAEHPRWTRNLLADPRAVITVSGEHFPVRAELLAGGERSRWFPAALENWPPYATCARRSGRELRLFLLSPAG